MAQGLGAIGEAGILMVLPAVGFDLANTLKVIHEQRVHGAGSLALATVAAVGSERIPQRAHGQQRQRRKRHRGQKGIGVKQDAADAENAQDSHGALLGAVDEEALDIVDILHHARHEVARGAFVEVIHRQSLKLGKHVAAHVEHDILLEVVIDADAQAVEQIAQEKCAGQKQDGPTKEAGVAGLFLDDFVDDDLRELRVR